MITTNFERLPDMFLRVYEPILLAWAENFGKYGASIEVDLLRAPGSAIDLRAMSHKARLGARFWKTETGNRRITLAPLSEADVEIIAKHVEELPRIIELRRRFRERVAQQATAGAMRH